MQHFEHPLMRYGRIFGLPLIRVFCCLGEQAVLAHFFFLFSPSDGPTGYDGCQRGKSQLMLYMSVEPLCALFASL